MDSETMRDGMKNEGKLKTKMRMRDRKKVRDRGKEIKSEK